jgi:enamine deaminase RidA (YjgF/YER057c/UK114 family)
MKRRRNSALNCPRVGAPAAAYAMSVQTGDTVYLSGHIAIKDGNVWAGKLGDKLSTDDDGKAAARATAIDLLATLHAQAGDLNRVTRIVKATFAPVALGNASSKFAGASIVNNFGADVERPKPAESGNSPQPVTARLTVSHSAVSMFGDSSEHREPNITHAALSARDRQRSIIEAALIRDRPQIAGTVQHADDHDSLIVRTVIDSVGAVNQHAQIWRELPSLRTAKRKDQ